MKILKFKLPLSILLTLLLTVFIFSSCGKKGPEGDNKILGETLAPLDTTDAVNGDWIIKREMSDAEKLNPVVTNDATAEDIDF